MDFATIHSIMIEMFTTSRIPIRQKPLDNPDANPRPAEPKRVEGGQQAADELPNGAEPAKSPGEVSVLS